MPIMVFQVWDKENKGRTILNRQRNLIGVNTKRKKLNNKLTYV